MAAKKYLTTLILSGLLAACSGGGDVVSSSISSDNDNTSAAISANTFYPMTFYAQGDGYVTEAGYDAVIFPQYTKAYLFSPVNASTLEAASPKLSDYILTLDDRPLDPLEHKPLMQKVVGLETFLTTALIIDTSASTQQVNKNALIDEVKVYLDAVANHSDFSIRNQIFTLWLVGDSDLVIPVVPTFEADIDVLKTALDNIDWKAQGDSSALYQSIVQAVGTYSGSPSNGGAAVDFGGDAADDLVDTYLFNSTGETLAALQLSSVVLFAAGGDTVNNFNKESAQAALEWQGFQKIDSSFKKEPVGDSDEGEDTSTSVDGGLDLSGLKLTGKPMYYVSLGSSGPDVDLADLARTTIDTKSWSSFSFASALINAQLADIKARVDLNNLYMVRFPVFTRDGSVVAQMSSRTNVRDVTVTSEMSFDPTDANHPSAHQPSIEITNGSGDYLPLIVSVSKVTKLYPAARWDYRNQYTNFSWTVDGTPRTAADDGSITIGSGDVGKLVILNSNTLNAGILIKD